ncbi:NAD(P)/FAD-dependent oxidoreductase [Rheinheimera maricola]|uniref:FAD-dependent oxidoreductase n=1 Tax=Rheinheimera maricola TaxID=2793282 RepID=A0ABS7X8B1_9GAMM|nr:FAD-dependent oxidoreductase [Rheinheimera maricola]MBZ9611786.1 FAD-dependent oxidoreductase [Rheinheimera maricola]
MTEAELIIIGNGMACQRLLAELVQQPNRPTKIVVFGAEAKPAYNRVLLSGLLSNELPDSAAELASPAWYTKHNIELICDDAVVLIDRERKLVISRHGRYRRYQQLVLACGALPLTPAYARESAKEKANDSSGQLKPGLCHFRNWQDLATLRLAGQQLQHAVVVGGGFLGLEAAEGLRKLGMQVSLLQRGAYLLNRQLDATAATLLQQQLSARGLSILTNSEIERLNYKHGQLQSVRLTSGQQLKADIVVLALGIRPNISLAQQSGLSVKHGILVNRNLQSSDSAIYALGECIELNGETFGLVAPINTQAKQMAQTLCSKPAAYCSEQATTQLKISGIALSSCGDIASLCAKPDSFDGCTDYLNSELNEYRRLWWRGPYLVGAVLYGDTSLSQQLSQLITQQQPYHGCRSSLVLGRVEQGIAEPGMVDSAETEPAAVSQPQQQDAA